MGSFRLDPVPPSSETMPRADGLTGAVLLHNARWFIRIRWIVVSLLTGFGVAGSLLDPQVARHFGFLPPGPWPLYLAVILTILNLTANRWARLLSTRTTWRWVAANIWFQIVTDLLVLTALVCLVGSTSTIIGFTYLFHITLACIFFGRRDSFLVTLLSALLFLAAVTAQCAGLIPCMGILAGAAREAPDILAAAVFAIPSVFVWMIVWFLVSSLSDTVRQRDHALEAANQRLIQADEKINLQMLRVTHDLKAPFSGIESNIQVLKLSHWAEMPEPVRQIISKIDARSIALRARIGDILMLGSLRSTQAGGRVAKPVKLLELLAAVVHDVHELAAGKRVSVALAATDTRVLSDPEQLRILFSNLISNAIVYSHEGGTVDVRINEEAARVKVSVVDQGIGISEKALPHIFEDFFRTQEAATFNANSTGLGLAIVRQVANNLHLCVVVESEKDKGTVFNVFIPAE